MKMTNGKIMECLNGLLEIQKKEKSYYEKTEKKLFGGKIKIAYAISKNIEKFKSELKTYNDMQRDISEEYRETEKEQKALEREEELAKKENREPKPVSIILKNGKTKEEYFRKIKELEDIETDVDIYTIPCDLLDGTELDSYEFGKILFMLKE